MHKVLRLRWSFSFNFRNEDLLQIREIKSYKILPWHRWYETYKNSKPFPCKMSKFRFKYTYSTLIPIAMCWSNKWLFNRKMTYRWLIYVQIFHILVIFCIKVTISGKYLYKENWYLGPSYIQYECYILLNPGTYT